MQTSHFVPTVSARTDFLTAVPRQDTSSTSSSIAPSLSRDDLDRLFASEAADSLVVPTAQKVCVLGIDPDIGGAIAVMQWDLIPSATQLQLQDAKVELHDMPLVSVSIGKRFQRQACLSLQCACALTWSTGSIVQ